MHVRWDRIVALVLVVGLILFFQIGGLPSLPHLRISADPDPVVSLCHFAILAVGIGAVLKLLRS